MTLAAGLHKIFVVWYPKFFKVKLSNRARKLKYIKTRQKYVYYVLRLMSFNLCIMSFVLCLITFVFFMSYVLFVMSYVLCLVLCLMLAGWLMQPWLAVFLGTSLSKSIHQDHYFTVQYNMYLTLHSFSPKLCSATIDLKTLCSVLDLPKFWSNVCHLLTACTEVLWNTVVCQPTASGALANCSCNSRIYKVQIRGNIQNFIIFQYLPEQASCAGSRRRRSKCYPAKMNFKKMNKGDLKCIFLCHQEETQDYIFETCPAIRQKLDFSLSMKLDSIYGDVTEQFKAIQVFEKIDDMRTMMRKELL